MWRLDEVSNYSNAVKIWLTNSWCIVKFIDSKLLSINRVLKKSVLPAIITIASSLLIFLSLTEKSFGNYVILLVSISMDVLGGANAGINAYKLHLEKKESKIKKDKIIMIY